MAVLRSSLPRASCPKVPLNKIHKVKLAGLDTNSVRWAKQSKEIRSKEKPILIGVGVRGGVYSPIFDIRVSADDKYFSPSLLTITCNMTALVVMNMVYNS